MRVEQLAAVWIRSDELTPEEITDLLGVRHSSTGPGDVWILEPSVADEAASLDDQIAAVINPLRVVADKLSELAEKGAEFELLLTRSLLGPGVGMLCFMLDSPVIKFLADVGGSVWFDEYDETTEESAMRTPPPA
ncbi:DUF4279 domain-containing protein [Nonomuraea sp. CA-143628]|uniref:DUF4279 domain-containing protein n=1 Tax=Nonomuraea sp. CA-143628 TaxID=3239997 RepID=UPI003D934BFC